MKKDIPANLVELFVKNETHIGYLLNRQPELKGMFMIQYVHLDGTDTFTVGQFQRFLKDKKYYISPLYEALK